MTDRSEFSAETIQAFILGALNPETAAQIELAMQRDAELAAEVKIWRAVRKDRALAASRSAPGDIAWARIERAIAADSNPAVANDNRASDARAFWQRPMFAPWQAAATVAVAIAGWQIAAVPMMSAGQPKGEPGYALAAGEQPTEVTLRVAFTPATSEAEMRALLRRAGGRIIDGPSAIGLYTIVFANSAAKAQAARILTERRDLVAEVAE
jgi:anti-sigma-K factor RskA